MTLTVVLIANRGALAQDAPEPVPQESTSRLFDQFVVDGGIITMFVLIPLSIATIALIVEHSFSIRQRTVIPADTLNRLRSDLEAQRFTDVVRHTEQDSSVLSQTIRSGLTASGKGYAAMQRAMNDTIEQAAARMMRKIEYLNVIGNVSPMIGLFGTVVGMIRLFASIAEAGGIPEPARIAENISIALVTTFWGLLVAIPALSVFAFFRNRIDSLATECAATAELLLSGFEPGGESVPASTAVPAAPPAPTQPAAPTASTPL